MKKGLVFTLSAALMMGPVLSASPILAVTQQSTSAAGFIAQYAGANTTIVQNGSAVQVFNWYRTASEANMEILLQGYAVFCTLPASVQTEIKNEYTAQKLDYASLITSAQTLKQQAEARQAALKAQQEQEAKAKQQEALAQEQEAKAKQQEALAQEQEAKAKQQELTAKQEQEALAQQQAAQDKANQENKTTNSTALGGLLGNHDQNYSLSRRQNAAAKESEAKDSAQSETKTDAASNQSDDKSALKTDTIKDQDQNTDKNQNSSSASKEPSSAQKPEEKPVQNLQGSASTQKPVSQPVQSDGEQQPADSKDDQKPSEKPADSKDDQKPAEKPDDSKDDQKPGETQDDPKDDQPSGPVVPGTSLYSSSLNVDVEGSKESIELEIAGQPGNIPAADQDAIDMYLATKGISDYTLYSDVVYGARFQKDQAKSAPMYAAQTADGPILMSLSYDEATRTYKLSQYSVDAISFDFITGTLNPAVRDTYTYTLPQSQPEDNPSQQTPEPAVPDENTPSYSTEAEEKPGSVQTDPKTPVSSEAKPAAPADTVKPQSKPVAQAGGTASFSQQAENFVNTYCASSSGQVYASASTGNFRQILNGFSSWKKLSATVHQEINAILKDRGGNTFQNLFIQANRIRLGLSSIGTGAVVSRPSVTPGMPNVSGNAQTDAPTMAPLWIFSMMMSALGFFVGMLRKHDII